MGLAVILNGREGRAYWIGAVGADLFTKEAGEMCVVRGQMASVI